MYVRLGFAVAVNVDPDILLVDEVLSVGDEAFQRKCLERVKRVPARGPHDPVRHPRAPTSCARSATARSCSTTASWWPTAPPGEAVRIVPRARCATGESGSPSAAGSEDEAAADDDGRRRCTAARHRSGCKITERHDRASGHARRPRLVAARRSDDDPRRATTRAKPTDDLLFGIAIHDEDGQQHLRHQHRDPRRRRPDRRRRRRGRRSSSTRVPLLDGTYLRHARDPVDDEGTVYDWQRTDSTSSK